ncbi:uncharacterized protein LOC112048562 [Bicyclus anynana]|uniref:Uncharacterized protein LOC112048562 n=1 Tax=Bicyclus anynana TaxID=110368 RepID=A0A6J1NA70_BICAN|nr:uncharacterized protein LOC112048562 [Bicyclus anynana]
MSLNNDSVWATCPADILVLVFKKLDIESVISCRGVNTFWCNVAEYCFEHFKLWPAVIQHTIGEAAFTEKSILGWRDKVLSAERWLDVSKVSVSFRHRYNFETVIQNICVYRDNLIVTTDTAATYFNINNFEVIKTLQFKPLIHYVFDLEVNWDYGRTIERINYGFIPCGTGSLRARQEYISRRIRPQELETDTVLRYQETSSFIVELKFPTEIKNGLIELSLTNKLYTDTFGSDSVQKVYIKYPFIFKVNLNSCYVIYGNVLWKYTATVNHWDKELLAKYNENENLLHSIHIYRKNVYVLLTIGDVLLLDSCCKNFLKIFHLSAPLSNTLPKDSLPLMFHTYILLRNVPNAKPCDALSPYIKCDFLKSISREGVTCVLEHGHATLFGYKNGEIEIYLHKNLIDSEVPELKFNLQTYIDDISDENPNLKIRALDIYYDNTRHHLFVTTCYHVYELLLCF